MTKPAVRIALLFAVAISLVLAPAAVAGRGGGGGGGKPGSCTQKSPYVKVDNTWAWAATGSFGLPGQPLTYAINVMNYDVGCGSTTFAVDIAAPAGFFVSLPTSTVTLKSGGSAYLWATVTSPADATDGDYALAVSVRRSTSSSSAASYTSYYKVYSSDTVAPTLFWPSPSDGATISGRSYNVAVSSSDDHAVKKIELYLDGVLLATKGCDNVSYTCELNYPWSPVRGAHAATFRSYDWLGNAASLTTTFTVG